MPAFKIASGDLANTPLLRHVAAFGRPMFVSTGGGTLEDVERAVDTVLPLNEQLCVMQCTASYPCEVEELEPAASSRRTASASPTSWSDSPTIRAASRCRSSATCSARASSRSTSRSTTPGRARITPSRSCPRGCGGSSAISTAIPDALGDGVKRPLASEERPLEKMGKKLVAARDLPVGHVLAPGDLVAKSPADGGLPPYELESLVGRTLVRPLAFEQAVADDDVERVDQPVAAREA